MYRTRHILNASRSAVPQASTFVHGARRMMNTTPATSSCVSGSPCDTPESPALCLAAGAVAAIMVVGGVQAAALPDAALAGAIVAMSTGINATLLRLHQDDGDDKEAW
ncbi:hypothetical protein pmac_cds_139 [Pandoravirus macleodensis]|uniref:Uncharacterized protein n=1 Tax=Pandoravirus macleodensis TaxID=2107707 RepID=A0A2U7UEG8_9VIRU|nr:hypothetical protein pmac_cds_139 [Pandoravirus macleodensis]AVK76827.1 hypothetical protein pmac_cds_139 [Pandoravirus macleodensis]